MPLEGSPPDNAAPVTLSNWQQPPNNRWAFWRMRELLPTQRVACDAKAWWPLPTTAAPLDVLAVPVQRMSGAVSSVGDVLADTHTDAVVVLQNGRIVHEAYSSLGAPDRPHLLMSVTKSLVGCVAAVLLERGVLEAAVPVERYVPELGRSGFAGATVRHLLDMRSGVAFTEDYTDPRSDVRELDAWVGWRAGHGDEEHRGLYAYLARLGADRPHGASFLYRSCDTDALGWVIERAAGERMADLLSELLWQPLGAEHDADLLCDGVGAAIHDGGLNATARDMARFGQLLLDGGRSPARVVLPPEWLTGAWAVDADARGAFAASPAEVSFPGGWYRNSFWFRPGDYGDVLLCLGIHGQMVHVSRRTRTVCVKFSSWPQPQQSDLLQDTVRAFDAVGGALAGRDPVQGRRGLPGVVAGLSRSGGLADRPGLKGGS